MLGDKLLPSLAPSDIRARVSFVLSLARMWTWAHVTPILLYGANCAQELTGASAAIARIPNSFLISRSPMAFHNNLDDKLAQACPPIPRTEEALAACRPVGIAKGSDGESSVWQGSVNPFSSIAAALARED